MPKQQPKQCAHCEYVAGNGGALSSHMKSKHPSEWDAFKSQQESDPQVKLSPTEPAPDEPTRWGGFRVGVYFTFEVHEEDTTAWQALAASLDDAILINLDTIPDSTRMTNRHRGALIPFRLTERETA